ncbi:phage Tail Collar [Minicystis rosea]|nr:phage Tail Collar [Minicystis rosea]
MSFSFLFAFAATASFSATAAAANVCLRIDETRDKLSGEERRAAQSIFAQAVESGGDALADSACERTYVLSHGKFGRVLYIHLEGPGGSSEARCSKIEELERIYRRLMRTTHQAKPKAETPPPQTPVTPQAQATPPPTPVVPQAQATPLPQMPVVPQAQATPTPVVPQAQATPLPQTPPAPQAPVTPQVTPPAPVAPQVTPVAPQVPWVPVVPQTPVAPQVPLLLVVPQLTPSVTQVPWAPVVPQTPVASPASGRCVADKMFYARLGGSALPGVEMQGGPDLGLGMRFELEHVGIDASMSFGVTQTGPRKEITGVRGSWLKLTTQYYFLAHADSTPYLGAGLSWGGRKEEINHQTYSATGLQGEIALGYEFLRSSTIRIFVQADATLPFYEAKGEAPALPIPSQAQRLTPDLPSRIESRYLPTIGLSLGIGWGRPRALECEKK